MVTNALPSQTYFTFVEIGTDQITVEGEANNAFTAISYAAALEAQETFSEVRVAKIDEVEIAEAETTEAESTRVSFKIIISR